MLYEMEKNMIFDTLNRTNWNKTKASKILGISVRTMRNKLNEYGIKDMTPEE
jgi:two-component system response regulator FlrC